MDRPKSEDSSSVQDLNVFRESHDRKQKLGAEDITAKVVGDFGRWQLWISIFMSLLKLCGAWYQLNIIFMAPPQEFWCAKPRIMWRLSEREWRKICSPKLEEWPCLIFDPDILSIAPHIDRGLIPLVPCQKFVYDKSVFKRTMTADWDLVCDRHWMIHVTQCVMMTGVLLGGLIFGMFADKYGRKNPLMYAILIQAVCSFIASFLPWYWAFLVVWFILALCSGGITIISFVLCMEAVSGKWRTIIPVLYQLPFGLGNTVMAVLAYYLRDWRKLEIALASLSSLYILYWLWIPESPRWLIADGQIEKAVDELYRAAKINKLNWTKKEIRALIPKPKPSLTEPPKFLDYMSYPGMRLKTILLSLNWLFTGLAFYTFSQYLGGIGGNIFVTVAVTGALSAPGPIVCVFVVASTGRKTTIWIFQFLTALCFVIIWILPKDAFGTDWPRITFAGIGFAAMAASVPTLYLYSGELYPTLGRNRGVGGVTMFARFGSMVAPFIVMLESLMEDLPLIFLALTSFTQMILLVPLPETKNQPLPNTIEEAERFVRKRSQAHKLPERDVEEDRWYRFFRKNKREENTRRWINYQPLDEMIRIETVPTNPITRNNEREIGEFKEENNQPSLDTPEDEDVDYQDNKQLRREESQTHITLFTDTDRSRTKIGQSQRLLDPNKREYHNSKGLKQPSPEGFGSKALKSELTNVQQMPVKSTDPSPDSPSKIIASVRTNIHPKLN